MNSSIAEPSQCRTIIQKVLVLGENPALMAGFVNQVSGSNIAYHLYSSLGVGIGVTRVMVEELVEVIMQLWLIPRNERLSGINEHFRRGHTGAVVVLSGAEIPSLRYHLETMEEDTLGSSVVIIIGSHEEAVQAQNIFTEMIGTNVIYHRSNTIEQTISVIGNTLMDRYCNRGASPVIIRLNEDDCPEYHYVPGQGYLPECSPEDIEYIRETSEKIGASVIGDFAYIDLDIGKFAVNLKTGATSLSPVLCNHCKRSCKRSSNICIVGIDEGWASEEIGNRALLVIAKIWAIAVGELPDHVQKQIRYALQCKYYTPDRATQDILSLHAIGYGSRRKRPTLLEDAGERVSLQRLTNSAFEVLKNKWHQIRQLSSKDED